MKLLIIHGPNINLTGKREPDKYGSESIEDINAQLKEKAAGLGVSCDIFQSNHEGEIIDKIHSAMGTYEGIILNAGAYTHYSYAIRDAIAAVGVACVEVHFSNIHARDDFRRNSVIAPVCVGSVAGFGKYSYIMAMHYFAERKDIGNEK